MKATPDLTPLDPPALDRQALATVAARLGACAEPFLIGVRHHSAACAAAMPAWLEEAAPERVFVELPGDAQPWIEWLGHPDARPPLALAAGAGSFWPFAAFSPELVAIRWARARGIPVEAFDLPVGRRGVEIEVVVEGEAPRDAPDEQHTPDLPDWDALVEAPAVGSTPDATRRAALLYGWALRRARGASPHDLAREAWMRARLADANGQRCAVVTGAFHDAALHPDATLDPVARVGSGAGSERPGAAPSAPTAFSLVPYRVDLFDSRSGYPAGIEDPGWHGRVYTCLTTGAPLDAMVAGVLVEVCRAVRAQHHPAGPPDAVEALRLVLELTRLRGRSAPGRAEVLEAVQTVLGQGEVLGRGRVLAKALEQVLVGTGRGQLAPDTPRSGLVPAVERLLAALRLPGPHDPEPAAEVLLRLDPLRSDLDRRRHVTLHRLAALHVPYAILADVEPDTLTHAWRVRWEPGTEAGLALAGAFGVDLEQATTGALARERPRDDGEGGASAAEELEWLTTVAECGLVGLARAGLETLARDFPLHARLGDMVGAVALVDRIAAGHVPGLSLEGAGAGAQAAGAKGAGPLPGATLPFDRAAADLVGIREALYVAAVRALDGLAGATDPADARALGALVRLAIAEGRAEDGRLGFAVDALAADGAPMISGAATLARLRLGRATAAAVGALLGARIHAAEGDDARRDLGDHLVGAIGAAGTLLESHPPLLEGLADPIEGLPDARFLHRLPALRHGFDGLSTAARERLLAALEDRFEPEAGAVVSDALSTSELATLAAIDLAARAAVVAAGLWPAEQGEPRDQGGYAAARGGSAAAGEGTAIVGSGATVRHTPVHTLGPLTRWRLVLGRDPEALDGGAARYAQALDELYGHGHGEGSRGRDEGGGAGRGARFPTAREWSDEIGALFGEGLRVEVVGRAAERGDPHALLLLDPDTVTPSVALLEQALSLKGGLSESQLDGLRRLCRRITEALAAELAVRVRPALTGLGSPRPTRRRTDRLHLRRTVDANLRTATHDGTAWRLVPERLYFRARARREMDWHVMLLVDTSGSMEASVVYAAMMASILAALPALTVSFFGFADDVVDFTERVDDPLALLLDVKIGGGTRIHRALRYAREQVRVPTRTLLVLVTDFEEGGSPSALVSEVRALAEAGVTMLGLAALDDTAPGQPARARFCEPVAARVVAAGMPVAALSPLELARWVGERVR